MLLSKPTNISNSNTFTSAVTETNILKAKLVTLHKFNTNNRVTENHKYNTLENANFHQT